MEIVEELAVRLPGPKVTDCHELRWEYRLLTDIYIQRAVRDLGYCFLQKRFETGRRLLVLVGGALWYHSGRKRRRLQRRS
jgi:hypothetical protein